MKAITQQKDSPVKVNVDLTREKIRIENLINLTDHYRTASMKVGSNKPTNRMELAEAYAVIQTMWETMEDALRKIEGAINGNI